MPGRHHPRRFVTTGKVARTNNTSLRSKASKTRGIALVTEPSNLYPTVEDRTIQEDTMKYIKRYLSKHFPEQSLR